MRKEKDVTITAEGRDQNKKFHIKEMPAMAAWDWSVRATLALANAGANVSASGGMAAVASIGIIGMLSQLKYTDAKPLMDDMLGCVSRVESATCTRSLIESDCEEVQTILLLHKEVLELHLGFSLAEKFRTSGSEATAGSSPST